MPFFNVAGKPVSGNARGTVRYRNHRLPVAAQAAVTFAFYWPVTLLPVFNNSVTMAVNYIHANRRIVDVDIALKAI